MNIRKELLVLFVSLSGLTCLAGQDGDGLADIAQTNARYDTVPNVMMTGAVARAKDNTVSIKGRSDAPDDVETEGAWSLRYSQRQVRTIILVLIMALILGYFFLREYGQLYKIIFLSVVVVSFLLMALSKDEAPVDQSKEPFGKPAMIQSYDFRF